MYCYFKFISTQCHCYFLLYFQIYCNISLSYTFKSTYIIIKACGSWSPYIGREVSSYFRPQISKFRLYSWHFRHRNLDFKLAVFTIIFCAHRPKTMLLFQNYFNREDRTGGHVWHRLGSSTKPLKAKGDPNYIIYPNFWYQLAHYTILFYFWDQIF